MKRKFLEKLIETLHTCIREQERWQGSAQIDANEHGGAMISRYDTFKEEAQALVSAFEGKKLALKQALSGVRSMASDPRVCDVALIVRLGAIVTLKSEDNGSVTYFLVSVGAGGIELECEQQVVHTLGISSPLGRLLVGKKESEFISAIGGGKYHICDVL